jgi:hypothetical protein
MMTAFYLLCLCGLTMIVASHIFPEALREDAKALVWQDWREPLRGESGGRWLGNYRVLSVVVIAVFVLLYYSFR